MPGARSTTHIMPVNAAIKAAPEEARGFGGVHREINSTVWATKCATDGLSREIPHGSVQQRQACPPSRAIVARDSHFEGQPIANTASAPEKANGVAIIPQQPRLVVEVLEIAK